jgi:hypothetical protein
MPFAADFRDEEAALKYEEERQKKLAQQRNTLETANRAGAIHRLYPHITPGVALSLAKSNASEQTIETVAKAEAQRLVNGSAERQARIAAADKPKGPAGAFRTGVKYATAALALPYEAGVNVASQVFAGGDPGVANGFFISTSLGSLIKDGEKSGSGYFIGGEAQKNQADRARRYRGTVGGQAWTPGRGAASLVAEPGSEAYNILSGLVDAASVITLDPLNKLVPAGLKVGAEGAGLTSWGPRGKILPLADDVVEGITGAAKADDALTAAGGVYATARNVDPVKARNWLDSGAGRRVTEKLAETATLAETRKILPNVSTRTQLALTDAKTVEDVRAVLAPRLGLESGLIKTDDIKYKSIFTGQPSVSERSRITKLFDKMPSRAISLRASDRGIDEAVENVDRWLRSTGYTEAERAPVIEEFARAFTGVMDPQVKSERIAKLQSAAESALDDEHRAAFQDLIALQDESTAVSQRAVAEGFVASTFGPSATKTDFTRASLREWLRQPNQLGQLRNVFDSAVQWMEQAGIGLDSQTLRPTASLRVGVRNAKGKFDRFGNRLGGEIDDLVNALGGRVQEFSRRGWVKFGESARDRGMGTYRGGTKNFLQGIDQALNAMTFTSGAEMSIAQFAEEFARNADIIDTLRPFFSGAVKQGKKTRVTSVKVYGNAGDLLDPVTLFGREFRGVSFEDVLEATRNTEVLSALNARRLDNAVDEFVEDALAGRIDELAGYSEDEVNAMIGLALSGTEGESLKVARAISKQLEEAQTRLDGVEQRFKSVGLPPRGTARADLYQVAEKFRGMVRDGLVRSGVDEEMADELLNAYYSNISEQSLYAIDEAGNVTDFGFGKALLPNEGGELVPTGGVLASPGLRSEMLSRHLYLPDPRKVRRLQSRFLGQITGVRKSNPELAGELRLPAAFLEFFQQDLWRPLTLMTGGYVLRNIAEAQARMTLLSRTSIFKHPLQHIMWASGWKGAGDVLGKAYQLDAPNRFLVRGQQAEEVAGLDDFMRASHEEYIAAIGNAYHRYGGDPIAAQQRAIRSGDFRPAAKTNRREYIAGYADELRQLHDDPVGRMLARGADEEAVMRWFRETQEGRTHWNEINEMFEAGVRFVDETGTVKTVQASMLDERNLRNYVNRYVAGRLNLKAGEVGSLPDNILRDVAAFGLVRNGDELVLTAKETSDLRKFFTSPGKDDVGTVYVVKREAKRVRGRRVEEVTYGRVTSVDDMGNRRMVLLNNAWDDNRNPTAAFKRAMNGLLDDQATAPLLPSKIKYEVRVSADRIARGPAREAARRVQQGADGVVEKFFGQLFGRTTAYLDRSPLFRQRYWEQVETILPVVSGEAVAALRSRVTQTAERLGVKPEQYVGSKALWKKLEAVDATRTGRLGLEQIDDFAKGHALDAVKRELYNATDRNNLTDVARVIAPFGQAWGEILQTWTKLVVSDPRILRRANVMVEGAKGADPDGDGRGFFYKDPQTGQYVFNYPLSDKFIGLLTGPVSQALNKVPVLNRFGSDAGAVNATLTAPIQTLSMGFSISPGLGPVAQFPASVILRNVPDTDDLKSFLMPYGSPQLRGTFFLPSWFQKFTSGVWDSPDTSRVMGQTYVEVVQHLYSSGDYNTSDINDRERMFEDAIGLARTLTVLRSFGQFIGPTRPSVEFQQGDLPTVFYAAELRKLQDPEQGGDYDTAVSNFLSLYPDAVAYLGAKTKSQYGGLDITEAYGKWEEKNAGILKRYRDVGGLFGPFDSTVNMAVFSRQLSQGKRTRQTGREVIDEAEFTAANAIYKQAADKFPGNRTEEQRALLKALRTTLGKKYPGFATLQSYDTRKFDRQLAQLQNAVKDEELAGNPVRDAVANYLSVRDQVLGIAESRGRSSLTSAKDGDLRDLLRQYGTALVKKYPDFVRLYDRVLAREVESDTDPSGE